MNLAMRGVHAVLQAGGQGQRLRPITETVPKPLLEVGGIPMVERLLRQIVECGVRTVTVITGWLSERVVVYFQGLNDLPEDLKLTFIREIQPLGNVGALAQLSSAEGPILFAFGDLVTDIDFVKLVKLHREHKPDITLTSHYETHRLSLGELLVQGDQVVGYQEKPTKKFLICSGIAVLEPCVIQLIDASHPTGISDLVNAAISHGYQVRHWTHGAFWMDVNSAAALECANQALLVQGR